MNEFNYTNDQAIAMLTARMELQNEIATLEAKVKEIDKEFKKLPQQDNANVFGVFKVWWKTTISQKPQIAYIKEHNPSAYNASLKEVKSDYFKVSI